MGRPIWSMISVSACADAEHEGRRDADRRDAREAADTAGRRLLCALHQPLDHAVFRFFREMQLVQCVFILSVIIILSVHKTRLQVFAAGFSGRG